MQEKEIRQNSRGSLELKIQPAMMRKLKSKQYKMQLQNEAHIESLYFIL